ncbi:hypothetical protein MBLNU457_6805t1 [Dothideomycetes sp. NU457]
MLPYHERDLRHRPPTAPAAMRHAFPTVNGLAPGQHTAHPYVLPTRMGNFALEDNNIRQAYAAQHNNHKVPRLLGAPNTRQAQATQMMPHQYDAPLQNATQRMEQKVSNTSIASARHTDNALENVRHQTAGPFNIISRDQDPFNASSEINRSMGIPQRTFANLAQPRSAPASGVRTDQPISGFVPHTIGNQTILRYAPYGMPGQPPPAVIYRPVQHPQQVSRTPYAPPQFRPGHPPPQFQPGHSPNWSFAPNSSHSDSFGRSAPSASMAGLGASRYAPQNSLSLSRSDGRLPSAATTSSYSGQGFISDSIGSASTLFTPMSENPYLVARSPVVVQAPTWKQFQTDQSFKLSTLEGKEVDEPFKHAYEMLKNMNPNVYQLPHGSCVVAVKCSNIANIMKAIEHGIWARPANVSQRIAKVCADRAPKAKVLLLFSVSGSKQFCGFAEVVDYMPDFPTDFWMSDDPKIRARVAHESAFTVQWIYCKLVAFDTVRLVDRRHEGESVTQMWNGMHYKDEVGRDVIKAYVEAPHVENLLLGKFKPAQGSAKRSTGRQSGRRPHSNPSHELIFHRDDVTASGRTMTNSELREQSSQSTQFNRLRPESDGTFAPPPVFGTPAVHRPAPRPSTPPSVSPAFGSPSPPPECPELVFSSEANMPVSSDIFLAYFVIQPDGKYRMANLAQVRERQPNFIVDAAPPASLTATMDAGDHVWKPISQDRNLAVRLNVPEDTAGWALVKKPVNSAQPSTERARGPAESLHAANMSTPSRGSSNAGSNHDQSRGNIRSFDGASPAEVPRPYYRYSAAYLKALSFTAPFSLTEQDYINAERASAIINDGLQESMAAPLSGNSMAYTSPTYAGASNPFDSPTRRPHHLYDWRNAGQWVDSLTETDDRADSDGGIMLWPRNPGLGER